MAQIIASRASALANTKAKNVAFGKIFGSVANNKRKSNIIFKSFKSQTKGGAVTKETIRKTIAGAKGLSMEDKRIISGKVLKGESASSRLQYVNDFSASSNKSSTGTIQPKPKVDMNKVMQEIRAKRMTPNGNPAGQSFPTAGRLSPGAPPAPPRLGQPGAAMTGSQFNQQFFKRGGSNLGLAGVAGTRH